MSTPDAAGQGTPDAAEDDPAGEAWDGVGEEAAAPPGRGRPGTLGGDESAPGVVPAREDGADAPSRSGDGRGGDALPGPGCDGSSPSS